MPCVIAMTTGEPIKVVDKTAAQVLALVKLGSWFVVKTDSFPGGDQTVQVRPSAVAYISEPIA